MSENDTTSGKRVRTWAFTLNNPSEEDMVRFENLSEDDVKWLVIAREYGSENQTLHYQGAFSLKHGKSWTATFKWLRGCTPDGMELKPQRASEYTNAAYCMKGAQPHCGEDKVPGCCEWHDEGVDGERYGEDYAPIREIGQIPKRSDGAKVSVWDDIRDAIEMGWTDYQIIQKWSEQGIRCQSQIRAYRIIWDLEHNQVWRDVDVMYVCGPTGIGKTRDITQYYGYKNVYRVIDKKNPWDQYDMQDVVIFEEFRNSQKFEDMLNWIDGHPVRLRARYADKLARFTKVFIVSNWDFEDQFAGLRRNHPTSYAAWVRRVNSFAKWDETESEMKVIMKNGSADALPHPFWNPSMIQTELDKYSEGGVQKRITTGSGR